MLNTEFRWSGHALSSLYFDLENSESDVDGLLLGTVHIQMREKTTDMEEKVLVKKRIIVVHYFWCVGMPFDLFDLKLEPNRVLLEEITKQVQPWKIVGWFRFRRSSQFSISMQEFHFSRQFRRYLLKKTPQESLVGTSMKPGRECDIQDGDVGSDVASIEDASGMDEGGEYGEKTEERQQLSEGGSQKDVQIEPKCDDVDEEEFMGLILFGIAVTENPSKVRLTCKCFDATTESMRVLGPSYVVNVGKSRHDEYDEFEKIAMHGSISADQFGAAATSVPDGMHDRIVEVMKDHAIGVLGSVQKAADSVTLLEKKLQAIIEEVSKLKEKKDTQRTDSLF